MRIVKNPALLKLIAIQRYLLWHSPTTLFDHIRIAEFPKSGGTWLGQMLSDLSGYPFPRNTWMSIGKGIHHSHLTMSKGEGKTILLVRDGRDVVVSAYYHFLFAHEINPPSLIRKWRGMMEANGVSDIDDIRESLPTFIQLFFKNFKVGGQVVNWVSHLRSFDLTSRDIFLIKYEDLLVDPLLELRKVIDFLEVSPHQNVEKVVQKYSFENVTKRKPGEEDKSSFLRKGISGDWKNHFTDESLHAFHSYGLKELRLLGYE